MAHNGKPPQKPESQGRQIWDKCDALVAVGIEPSMVALRRAFPTFNESSMAWQLTQWRKANQTYVRADVVAMLDALLRDLTTARRKAA